MMKRSMIALSLLLVLGCLAAAPTIALAGEADTQAATKEALIASETSRVAELAAIRDLGAVSSCEIVYNHENQPKFILGLAEKGYVIADRDTWAVFESGGGPGPFAQYPTAKKYYGGLGSYVIDQDEDYLDVITRKSLKTVPFNEAVDEMGRVDASEGLLHEGEDSRDSKSLAVASTKYLPNYQSYIARRAFGYNQTGTCTAVACGIALNYLDKTVSSSFVSSDMESENLEDQDLLVDGVLIHSQAEAMHRFLVDNCAMYPINFGDVTTQSIDFYRMSSSERASTTLTLSYEAFLSAAANWNYLTGEIDSNMPAMLTTTLQNWTQGYNFHTVVVYGYRTLDNGSQEILVHPGWDGDSYITDAPYKIIPVWAPVDIASYVYKFGYKLVGWHNTPSGRHFYDEDGNILQPLPVDRLGGSTRYDTMELIAIYNRASAATAVVVSGESSAWPDALSASGLAGLANGPVLTTATNYLPAQTAAAISYLGVSNVIIVGGTTVVSDTVRNQIGAIVGSGNVTRIGGVNRYETAELVYSSYYSSSSWVHPAGGYVHSFYSQPHSWKNGSSKKMAILATGTDFPDAMAASSLSAYMHAPIFLVRADGTLTTNTQSLLQYGNFDEILAVGAQAIPAAASACSLVDPKDITGWTFSDGSIAQPGDNWYWFASGSNRYATASKVYGYALQEGMPLDKVCIASGTSPVDAVPGGALKYPILLASEGSTTEACNIVNGYAPIIHTAVFLGGTAALPDSIVTAIRDSWYDGMTGGDMTKGASGSGNLLKGTAYPAGYLPPEAVLPERY